MSISTLIASNVSAALSMVKKFTSNPKINGIVIEATRFECNQDSEVSRLVLITQDQSVLAGVGLQTVMDNVSPGPRVWNLEGYLGGSRLELSSLFMPSLRLVIDLFQEFVRSRQIAVLIDPQFRIANVLISRFNYSQDPLTANRVAVKFELVEITTLQTKVGGSSVDVPVEVSDASPVAGTTYGASLDSGQMSTLALPDVPADVVERLGTFAAAKGLSVAN